MQRVFFAGGTLLNQSARRGLSRITSDLRRSRSGDPRLPGIPDLRGPSYLTPRGLSSFRVDAEPELFAAHAEPRFHYLHLRRQLDFFAPRLLLFSCAPVSSEEAPRNCRADHILRLRWRTTLIRWSYGFVTNLSRSRMPRGRGKRAADVSAR